MRDIFCWQSCLPAHYLSRQFYFSSYWYLEAGILKVCQGLINTNTECLADFHSKLMQLICWIQYIHYTFNLLFVTISITQYSIIQSINNLCSCDKEIFLSVYLRWHNCTERFHRAEGEFLFHCVEGWVWLPETVSITEYKISKLICRPTTSKQSAANLDHSIPKLWPWGFDSPSPQLWNLGAMKCKTYNELLGPSRRGGHIGHKGK